MKETHPQLSQQPGGWIANLVRIICCRGSSEKKGYALVAQGKAGISAPDNWYLQLLKYTQVDIFSLRLGFRDDLP